MQQGNKTLHVIQGNDKRRAVNGTTCFAVQAKFGVDCQRQKCKHWISHPKGHNCVLIAVAQEGPHTLQEIGQIYGLTRMRICQIEKSIFDELRSNQ